MEPGLVGSMDGSMDRWIDERTDGGMVRARGVGRVEGGGRSGKVAMTGKDEVGEGNRLVRRRSSTLGVARAAPSQRGGV